MHYYSFNIGDFDKVTRHLSITERGLFRDLLDLYIKEEKPVTSDMKKLERLLCVKSKSEKIALQNVLEDFFTLTDDGFYSEFCQAVLDKTTKLTSTASENGKKGGRPPKQPQSHELADTKPNESENKAKENPNETQTKPKNNPNENYPIPINPTPINPLNISFDEFWEAYDKKVGDKSKIESKWNKLKDQERIAVMNHIPQYKNSQPDKQYRKNPETYLNNKSWNDEIITGQNHANNQPNHRQHDTATTAGYSAKLAKDLAKLGYSTAKPTASHGDWIDVQSVEVVV